MRFQSSFQAHLWQVAIVLLSRSSRTSKVGHLINAPALFWKSIVWRERVCGGGRDCSGESVDVTAECNAVNYPFKPL